MRHLTYEALPAPLAGDDAVATTLSSGPPLLFCCGVGAGVAAFINRSPPPRSLCFLSWITEAACAADYASHRRGAEHHPAASDALGIMDTSSPRVALARVRWSSRSR